MHVTLALTTDIGRHINKRLGEGNGDDNRAIFSIWNPFEPPLVLASNWLDGSQYRILVRRPKKESSLENRFSWAW